MRFSLGEVGRRRLARFRSNRRGVWSLRIFAVLFTVTMLAELVANDAPLLMRYAGEWYVPVARSYPETAFGGFLDTEADYRDPAVREMIEADGWILWPPIPFSYDTVDFELGLPAPSPPSARHWLGTDDQARDVAARLIYGFRLSVLFGLILTTLSSLIGVTAGAIQGYFGGAIDLVFQRFIEIWSSLPTLYLLIIMASLIRPSFWWLLGLLLLFSWTQLVAVVRAEFLRVRNFDYIRAARALGARDATIMVRHILPNATVATLTYMPFVLAGGITSLTALDFLGLGLPAGSPSLGEILNQGKNSLQAPWLGLSAFAVLAALLSLLVFIGEAVRDALDARKIFAGTVATAAGVAAVEPAPALAPTDTEAPAAEGAAHRSRG
jgi:microcin C transport system permease protein